MRTMLWTVLESGEVVGSAGWWLMLRWCDDIYTPPPDRLNRLQCVEAGEPLAPIDGRAAEWRPVDPDMELF